ncbi:MAG: hypothetical protein H2212_15580 [Ruminococcus sp.]|jgi:hypothetical protein|nr:hypothetical protein [Ruminococcus sp.]
MTRFQYKKNQYTYRRLILSICVFLLIVIFFYQGIDSLSESSLRRQRESLENALNRSITYCYAVEGSYPQSLAYLKEHYGLTYNENKFFVDYRVSGANVLPDVTVIEMEEGD